MKKILIVDDRPQRQKNDLGTSEYERLNSLPNVKCSTSFEIDELADYDIVAIHTSILSNSGQIKTVREELAKKGKLLILFSGGTAVNQIIHNGKELDLKSSVFYREETVSYFDRLLDEHDSTHLLERLLYGQNWEVVFLQKYSNILWKNEKNDDWSYEDNDIDQDDQDELRCLEQEFGHCTFVELNTRINKKLKI